MFADVPISSLPIAISLDGSEYTDLVQGGTTKRAQVSLINSANVANIPIGGLTGQGLVKQSDTNYDTKWATVAGFGTVQQVDTGTGLTGGPITLTGTVSLAPVAAGRVLANVTGGSAAPIPNTPSVVLDVIGSTRGQILYRGVAGWLPLSPGSVGQILTTGGAGADPAWSAVGSGSVTSVGLSLPAIFTVSGSPVTSTGTLTGTLANQSANLVWAGPGSGAAAAPAFRALVGADLPNPAASTLGGIQSYAGVSSQWIRSISTSGVPASSQPAFSDISGQATGAQLPNPSASTLGGVQSLAAVTSRWINTISTAGVPGATQPAFTDISGNAALSQLPSIGNNTVLANTSGGSAVPSATSLTTLLDTLGSTQGQVLYRNASTWVPLAVGSAGQVLTTNGAAANPSWATVTGTGTVTSVDAGTGISTGGSAITGAGTVSLAAIAGSRILANITGGSAAPIANTMTSLLDIIGSTQGQVLYRGASNWTALSPGTSGQYLQTLGAGSTPQWAAPVTSVVGDGLTITSTGTLPPRFGYANATIAVSAAASALTIALKDNSGADPSATSPATFIFRNTTGTTGSWTQLSATGAMSLVISSGSTLGVTSSTAFRLWVVMFNDGGTLRLGVVNCFISAGNIFPLNDFALVSSTAEGGAGAADSAGVIYTGTAVSAKAYRILGYVEWNTSGVTAGTWTTGNVALVQTFGLGVPKPGDVVQTAYATSPGYTSGATNFPNVTTVPLNTYGDEFITRAITPTSAANNLKIESQVLVASGLSIAQSAVFQDSITNGLVQSAFQITLADAAVPLLLHHEMKAGTASATTFKLRAGTNSGATMYINGKAGGAIGTVQSSYLKVAEIMA